ncbi:MAG: redoxin domain-containing protein [Myxococcota bacterium]
MAENDVQDPGEGPDEAATIAEELEGEGQQRLVGIMYSEKQWVVPEVYKVGFLLGAVGLVAGLSWFSIDKRLELRRLMMDSVVEPTPVREVAAPDFVLPEGETNTGLQLASLRGKWVLVNFWATWCPPCRDEMPSMEMLNRRFQNRNFAMLAVSVDENWGDVARFFGDTPPTFKVLWDRQKVTARRYGTSKFPETYLIAPDGRVAAKYVGPRDWYNQGTVEYFEGVLNGTRDPA